MTIVFRCTAGRPMYSGDLGVRIVSGMSIVETAREERRLDGKPLPRNVYSGFGYKAFLGWLLLLPGALYPLMFVLAALPGLGFDRWGGSKWPLVLNYGLTVKNENAQVVIFGDSSAFLAIDPRRVEAASGLHTVVLPNTIGSLPVLRDLALRRYMANNTTPRIVVLYFAPWDIDFEHPETTKYFFEGEQMLLRTGGWREIGGFALRHPLDLLAFPWQLNSMLTPHNLRTSMTTDAGVETARALGHVEYSDPVGPLQESCMIPEKYLGRRSPAAIADLVRRYRTPTTQVLVYLAPIPACRNAGVLLQRQLTELGAAPPRTLPPGAFAADGLYAHILPAHVAEASELLAETLRERSQAGWEKDADRDASKVP